MKHWLRSIENAFLPGKCLCCRQLFHPGGTSVAPTNGAVTSHALEFKDAMAHYFCPDCRSKWTEVNPPFCSRCGSVFNSRQGENHYCGQCLDRPGAFSRARAVGIYDQSLRIAIHELKFKRRVPLAMPMGALLFNAFQRYWEVGDIDMVAPVPLHRHRFQWRGFNQAYLLIRVWKLPKGTSIVRNLLVRSRKTAPQTGLDRKQRLTNIRNAFSMRRPGQSKGKRVLLVDDVLTTGATVDACARTLIKDGAQRVDVLTLARAM